MPTEEQIENAIKMGYTLTIHPNGDRGYLMTSPPLDYEYYSQFYHRYVKVVEKTEDGKTVWLEYSEPAR